MKKTKTWNVEDAVMDILKTVEPGDFVIFGGIGDDKITRVYHRNYQGSDIAKYKIPVPRPNGRGAKFKIEDLKRVWVGSHYSYSSTWNSSDEWFEIKKVVRAEKFAVRVYGIDNWGKEKSALITEEMQEALLSGDVVEVRSEIDHCNVVDKVMIV